MTRNTIADYTEGFGKAQFSSTDVEGVFAIQRRDTLVRLWLADERLRLYQVTWTAPLTRAFSEPKKNVCSGEQFVEVSLMGPETLAGGTITLDGQMVGRFPTFGKWIVDVPVGTHVLSVEKEGLGSWSQDVTYVSSSPGHDRLIIEVTEEGSDTL